MTRGTRLCIGDNIYLITISVPIEEKRIYSVRYICIYAWSWNGMSGPKQIKCNRSKPFYYKKTINFCGCSAKKKKKKKREKSIWRKMQPFSWHKNSFFSIHCKLSLLRISYKNSGQKREICAQCARVLYICPLYFYMHIV